MKRLVPLLLATLVLSGCMAYLKAEHVLTGHPGAPHGGKVQVAMEGAPEPGPSEEIAIVTASGTAENASLPVIVQALQREAASLGANAVIRVRYDHGASGATATGVAVRLQQ